MWRTFYDVDDLYVVEVVALWPFSHNTEHFDRGWRDDVT